MASKRHSVLIAGSATGYDQVFRALPYLPGSSEDNVREPKGEEPDTELGTAAGDAGTLIAHRFRIT
jgi:hypothetical protein